MMADKLSGQTHEAPPADARALIERHAGAAEPAWLWDARRSRIVWGNDAAVKFWDAGSALDLVEYRFLAGSPEAELGNGLKGGDERTAVLAPTGEALRAHVRAEAAVLFDGSEGVLVHIVENLPPVADPALARKAALFDSAPVALLLVEMTGEVAEANAAGQEYAATLGRDLLATLATQAVIRGSANRTATLTNGPAERSLRLFASRSEDEATVLIRIDDVTDRRALEAQAPPPAPPRASDPPPPAPQPTEGQDRVIANLSHEMRNPLNAIIGFSEIMQQRRFGPLGNHRYEGYVDDIHMSASHLLGLVNDLLDLGSLAEGRFKVHFEAVSLAAIVAESARMLATLASSHGIELATALEPALPPVVADARAMRQVLLNVMSNAIKFTATGGSVRVEGSVQEDGGVALSVRDNGIGMNSDELARALDAYGQVDSVLQRRSKGTGLGLPLAKALAEANKCEFHIVSAPQQGTTVTISFPAARVLAG
jgi:signal transduction histidine kinase